MLASFDRQLREIADVEAFGLVLLSEDTFADVCTRHRTGITAHRLPLGVLPPTLRPGGATASSVTAMAALVDPQHVFADRLRQYEIDWLLSVPLADGTGVFWTGKAGSSELAPEEVSALETLAETVAAAFRAAETREARLERLTRLALVDRMLPLISGALDVRDIFPRLSELAKSAVSHDVATIQILDEDLVHARLYALEGASADEVPQTFSTNYAAVFNEHFRFSIHDDLAASPVERQRPAAAAGMQSALRVPLWIDGRVGGALELSSPSRRAYNETDVPIARRIADYLTVAIGHFRMADKARRAAALHERSHSLLTLDQLLPALSGVLDVREVFGRVSEIARQLIPHDALGLPLLADDGEHIIPFATAGVPDGTFPAAEPLPDGVRDLFTKAWEFEIIEDAATGSESGATAYADAGYLSALRVPIRLEGRTAGALVFLSRTRETYTPAHVPFARRIAGHVALALSHHRIAEKARRNEELRARAQGLELLDDLLATITGSGELPDVFGRVPAVAQRALAHDALLLTAVNPDGVTARVYASQTPDASAFPEVVDVPTYVLVNPDWEHQIVDDLQALENERGYAAGRLGYRAALRVSIRLDGEYVADVSFLSFTPALYKTSDILVARRIADRLALTFARERRAAVSRRADEATARVSRLESRVRELVEELESPTGDRRLVGQSPLWRTVLTQATQVASTETTVLLFGESGTGKEVVARFIHRASSRQDGPFIGLNCAALPEQLLEAELFGYERGAFTGATQSKPGQLEQASGGTLFLDEVGEMNLPSQAKFLRVLQEREFQRLGGTRVLRTNARIVAATNRDLRRAIEQGTFREDLFYRLNVFAIALPPLRDRREDVLPLSEAFLVEYARSLGRPPSGISRDARKKLMEYDWPGNVRELRNILERASILCDGGLITAEHLALTAAAPAMASRAAFRAAPHAAPSVATDLPTATVPADLPSMERAMVEQALQKHRFNKSKAAKELGLTRAQLYVRMKRHGLE